MQDAKAKMQFLVKKELRSLGPFLATSLVIDKNIKSERSDDVTSGIDVRVSRSAQT
jgi:hypothetical protein